MTTSLKKVLVIDGQVFQTPAWHRGMGKYSIELLHAITTQKHQWEEVVILLSSKLPSDKEVLNELSNRIASAEVVHLDLLPNEIGNRNIPLINRALVTKFVEQVYPAKQTELDYLILSLMQGEIVPTFPDHKRCRNSVVFYDVIPLVFHEIYLRSMVTREEYLTKINELLRADTYLAISKTVANDLCMYLGVDPKRVVAIDGGPINHASDEKAVKIPKPFILMPTGNDLRKNNERGILGFGEFNKRHGNKYTLVVTSFFKDHQIEVLGSLAENVIFTGNISGEELNYLYKETSALLFPSEYEGLGLPILEALVVHTPVACSDISVFREISESAFCYFNPYDVESIANGINAAIKFRALKEERKRVLSNFTWRETATKLLTALSVPVSDMKNKIPVAVYTTDPSDDTLVPRVVQENHAELRRQLDIEYCMDPSDNQVERRVNYLPYISATHPIADIVTDSKKIRLYHLFNHRDAAKLATHSLYAKGIVVLHDLDLSQAWSQMLVRGYINDARWQLEQALNKKVKDSKTQFITSVAANAHGVVVFSERHKESLEKLGDLIGKKLNIHAVNIGSFELPYPEILPRKSNAVGVIGVDKDESVEVDFNTKRIDETTDFRFLEQVSRVQEIYLEENLPESSMRLYACIARVFGVGVNTLSQQDVTKRVLRPSIIPSHHLYASQIKNVIEGVWHE